MMDNEWKKMSSDGHFLLGNDSSNDINDFSDDIQTYLNIQIHNQPY